MESNKLSDTTPNESHESARCSVNVFAKMNAFRKRGQLCDVVVKVGGREFPAHRVVLAASSDYFDAMFSSGMTESAQLEVELKSVMSPDVMEALLDFVYTGHVRVNMENVQDLLPAASLVQMEGVKTICSEFLFNELDSSNVLGIRRFAELHNCSELDAFAKNYATHNFETVIEFEEFLSLSTEELIELLNREDLHMDSEETAYRAVIRWVYYDVSKRSDHLPSLLSHIRLAILSVRFLTDIVDKENLVRQSFECRDLVDEAKRYHLRPDLRYQMRSRRFRQRDGGDEYLVVIGGFGSYQSPSDSVEMFNPRTREWSELPNLPISYRYVAACSLGTCVYVIGGFDGGDRLNTVGLLDVAQREDGWRWLAPMHYKRGLSAACTHRGLIYVCGGFDGQTRLRSLEVYHSKIDEWRVLEEMNTAREGAGLVVADDCLYCLGGYDGLNLLSSMEAFDLNRGTWSSCKPMYMRRSGAGCAVLGDTIFVCGGYGGAEGKGPLHLDTVESYNTRLGQWTLVSNMNVPRCYVGACQLSGLIYVAAGYNGSRLLNTVEAFDPVENVWTLYENNRMHTERCDTGMCVVRFLSCAEPVTSHFVNRKPFLRGDTMHHNLISSQVQHTSSPTLRSFMSSIPVSNTTVHASSGSSDSTRQRNQTNFCDLATNMFPSSSNSRQSSLTLPISATNHRPDSTQMKVVSQVCQNAPINCPGGVFVNSRRSLVTQPIGSTTVNRSTNRPMPICGSIIPTDRVNTNRPFLSRCTANSSNTTETQTTKQPPINSGNCRNPSLPSVSSTQSIESVSLNHHHLANSNNSVDCLPVVSADIIRETDDHFENIGERKPYFQRNKIEHQEQEQKESVAVDLAEMMCLEAAGTPHNLSQHLEDGVIFTSTNNPLAGFSGYNLSSNQIELDIVSNLRASSIAVGQEEEEAEDDEINLSIEDQPQILEMRPNSTVGGSNSPEIATDFPVLPLLASSTRIAGDTSHIINNSAVNHFTPLHPSSHANQMPFEHDREFNEQTDTVSGTFLDNNLILRRTLSDADEDLNFNGLTHPRFNDTSCSPNNCHLQTTQLDNSVNIGTRPCEHLTSNSPIRPPSLSGENSCVGDILLASTNATVPDVCSNQAFISSDETADTNVFSYSSYHGLYSSRLSSSFIGRHVNAPPASYTSTSILNDDRSASLSSKRSCRPSSTNHSVVGDNDMETAYAHLSLLEPRVSHANHLCHSTNSEMCTLCNHNMARSLPSQIDAVSFDIYRVSSNNFDSCPQTASASLPDDPPDSRSEGEGEEDDFEGFMVAAGHSLLDLQNAGDENTIGTYQNFHLLRESIDEASSSDMNSASSTS